LKLPLKLFISLLKQTLLCRMLSFRSYEYTRVVHKLLRQLKLKGAW